MTTFGKAITTYVFTLLFLSCLITIAGLLATGFENSDGIGVVLLILFGTVLVVGLWSAIPVFAIWVPTYFLLKGFDVNETENAIFSAGLSATLGAIISAWAYGSVFGDLAGSSDVSWARLLIFGVSAMGIAFLVWRRPANAD